MNKILILFAHPSQQRSEINVPLYQASRNIEGITLVDLYHEYPTYQIDIDREQQRLLDHDIIVFMFPVYWYSTPAILKEWQDLVLEYGFAYGSEGDALHGKQFFCAATLGGPESAYQRGGFNQYSVRELLRPLEQMAHMCGMSYLPPFVLFGSRTAVEENLLASHISDWQRLLETLQNKTLTTIPDLSEVEALNMHLGTPSGGQDT